MTKAQANKTAINFVIFIICGKLSIISSLDTAVINKKRSLMIIFEFLGLSFLTQQCKYILYKRIISSMALKPIDYNWFQAILKKKHVSYPIVHNFPRIIK